MKYKKFELRNRVNRFTGICRVCQKHNPTLILTYVYETLFIICPRCFFEFHKISDNFMNYTIEDMAEGPNGLHPLNHEESDKRANDIYKRCENRRVLGGKNHD